MNDLEYIFDKDFLTTKGQSDAEGYVKRIFRELLLKPTEQLQVFNTIWANTGLRGNLFPNPQNLTLPQWEIQAKGEFVDIIKSLDNDFFGFIKVK